MSDPAAEASRVEAMRWLGSAMDELRAAELVLHAAPPLVLHAAFHAQQAAEKLLKALLIERQSQPPRTHNIAQLLGRTGPIPGLPEEIAAALERLTPWAVHIRYPGLEESGGPAAEDVREALAAIQVLAERVRTLIGAT